MVFNPESSKDLEDDFVKAHQAATALRSEVYNPTISRLFDDQVKLVQQEKEAQDKYWDLVARRRLQKKLLNESPRKGSTNS
jgi:predicted metal-dependent hydrolase